MESEIVERTAGNQLMVKENNQQYIIDTLIKKGATSRAELAKTLKLSAPSVSNNINPLLDKKILQEIGEGDSIGGRRPILLDFNYNYGYIIGIDLSSQNLKIALSNLKPEILEIQTIDISTERNGKCIIKIINGAILDILDKHKLRTKHLFTVALGFPGVVNEETGHLIVMPLWLNVWDDINIREEIAQKFKVKVIIKNDINLAALGEARFGVARDFDNLAYVNVDMGVGAGLIIHNRLYEGVRLAAGEIGYYSSSIADVNFDHRYYGPLESRIAIPGIVEKVKRDMASGAKSRIMQLADGDIAKIDVKVIERALELRDPYIMSEFEEIKNQLGIVLANISTILDLELVVLGGKLTNMGYELLTPLNEMVGRLTLLGTRVVFSSLEQKAVIYGSFAAALDYVYGNILRIR